MAKKSAKPRLVLSRPVDRSLAAYKDWITSTVAELIGNTDDDMTEAEWKAAWQEFWAKKPKPASDG